MDVVYSVIYISVDFELREGDKRTNPDKLTLVSDSGNERSQAPVTWKTTRIAVCALYPYWLKYMAGQVNEFLTSSRFEITSYQPE